jgi:uncharacterized protein (DUF305 family)
VACTAHILLQLRADRRRNLRGISESDGHMRILLAAFVLIACCALAATAQTAMQLEHGAAMTQPDSPDATFQRDMTQAMRRMDEGMMIRPSGNADRDFAAMMIPHHQGAIDMAKAELQFGRDPVLRRLAQGIIVEQQQEIELMRGRLDSTKE